MAIDFCSIWCKVGDALFSERVAFEFARLLCWKKENKDLESCFVILVLDHLEGEK